MSSLNLLAIVAISVFTLVSTWILGIRMRNRIKRTLGTEAKNETELTSLKTWISVEDAEERSRGGRLS